MRTLTALFKSLSDETRLRMLGLLLVEGELCVCDFVEILEITQSKASRHLRTLVNAGLLEDRREGSWVFFRITEEPGPAQARLLEVLPALLAARMSQAIIERLGRWTERKNREPTCAARCCPSPRMKPREDGGGLSREDS